MAGKRNSDRSLRYRRRSTIVVGTKKQSCHPRKKQRTKCKSWADLHEDILRLIKSKLYFPDQVSFSAVCKSWRFFGKPLMAMAYFSSYYYWKTSLYRPNDILPCQVPYSASDPNVNFACEIYDAYGRKIHKAKYNVSKEGWPSSLYQWPEVCASKKGWLLIVDSAHTSVTVSLCNPFSNLVVSVTRLQHQIDVANFSTVPMSPDCIIFVLYCSWGKTHLGTYCIGDENWRKLIIAEREFAPDALSVVYIEGVLYYVFEMECWDALVTLGNIGVLLATAHQDFDWRIFRFDQSQMTWIAEINLGKQALFASPTSFVVQAVGDEVDLADCICYFDCVVHKLKVYSLKDKEYKEPQHELLTCSHCFDLRHEFTIWIEPPNI